MGSNIISWSAQKQQSVSRSSTEAEYRTLSDTAAEIVWLINLMEEIGIPQAIPPELFCDNLSAVYLSATPAMHKRSKHFEVDFHFVREKVALGKLIVHHIPSVQMLADIFTKSLATRSFQELRFKLGVVVSPTQSLRGDVDIKDKKTETWRMKEKKGSETCSVSETEEQRDVDMKTVGLELERMPKAETSFTKNELGPQDTNVKPTQKNKEATVTLCTETKREVKDKESGPGSYGQREPITLKN